jgi:hypothetical protein
MRTRVIAILAAVVVAGCSPRQEAFICSGNPSSACGPTGACEANGFCSFPDSTCSSGRRYGDLGGPTGQCTGGELPPDVRPDTPPPDARLCFGTAPFTVCFTTPPTGNIDVLLPTTLNTDTGMVMGTQLNCVTPMSGGTGYCVVAADTISIAAPLRAVGSKPLVLVAATSISMPLAGSIDVSSHRLPTESIGAGADPSGCNAGNPPTNANNTSGGGAGGSFAGAGGNGGNGGNGGGAAGTRGSTITSIITVRGGCPAQDGAGNGHGARGHGGGAVFLIAGNTITIGGTINAGGEGGAGATVTADGGGGAGAGGMIGFDATTVTVTGALIANGGGGGEGSSMQNGNNGSDAGLTTAALGGANGSTPGGNGGDGSSGAAGGAGVAGQDGGNGGGGGGGGGGAGLIKAPTGASLTGLISPAATQP